MTKRGYIIPSIILVHAEPIIMGNTSGPGSNDQGDPIIGAKRFDVWETWDFDKEEDKKKR